MARFRDAVAFMQDKMARSPDLEGIVRLSELQHLIGDHSAAFDTLDLLPEHLQPSRRVQQLRRFFELEANEAMQRGGGEPTVGIFGEVRAVHAAYRRAQTTFREGRSADAAIEAKAARALAPKRGGVAVLAGREVAFADWEDADSLTGPVLHFFLDAEAVPVRNPVPLGDLESFEIPFDEIARIQIATRRSSYEENLWVPVTVTQTNGMAMPGFIPGFYPASGANDEAPMDFDGPCRVEEQAGLRVAYGPRCFRLHTRRGEEILAPLHALEDIRIEAEKKASFFSRFFS